MEIFCRLFLAHLLADFTFQTNYINTAKRSTVSGMFLHVFTHAIFSYILVRDYLGQVWFSLFSLQVSGWFALLAVMFVHFGVDELRVYLIKKLKYPDNTFSFVADQFAHAWVIFMFTPFSFSGGHFISEKWVFLVSCLVMVTHFTTVLFYFIERDLFQVSFPSFDQKYFMIFERAVTWAFFMMPGKWWIVLLMLWIAQFFYVKRKRIIDVSALNFYGSILSSCIFGALSRFVYYGL